MRMTGAQIVVKCLQECGVELVFGYPGGQAVPLYDALYDAPFAHILPVHEQGAIHAADGYARASGRVGVCIATSGPGATNIVTGLATAYMDSTPLVAITGQVPISQLGRDSFQEIDIVSVTLAMTKHSFQVTDIEKLASTIRAAFQIASSGRPGPVLIDIPTDVQKAKTDYQTVAQLDCSQSNCKARKAVKIISNETATVADIHKAQTMLAAAKRPVLLAGGGIISAQAAELFQQFAECAQIPVISTLMGLGVLPASHPQLLGLTGMHGHVPANKAIVEADVILAAGSRFSERITGDRKFYTAGKTIIHLEIDPTEVDKNITAQLPIIGDLQQLLPLLREGFQHGDYSEWWQTIRGWQKEYTAALDEATNFAEGEQKSILSARWLMQEISRQMVDRETIYVTDVGQNQLWAAQYLNIKGARNWITSGGCGTMGFGLPAAVGAKLAMPAKNVVHIAGDGGFKMTGMELYTAVQNKLPIISVIVNNNSLGMVKQWQRIFYQKRYSATKLPDFDFAGFATACGAMAWMTTTKEEFTTAFSQARDSGKTCVVIANISEDELVLPMIAPGATLAEYVQEEKVLNF